MQRRNKKDKNDPSDYFGLLPDELLLHTLTFFSKKQLCEAARLSHRFKQLSEDNGLWTDGTLVTKHMLENQNVSAKKLFIDAYTDAYQEFFTPHIKKRLQTNMVTALELQQHLQTLHPLITPSTCQFAVLVGISSRDSFNVQEDYMCFPYFNVVDESKFELINISTSSRTQPCLFGSLPSTDSVKFNAVLKAVPCVVIFATDMCEVTAFAREINESCAQPLVIVVSPKNDMVKHINTGESQLDVNFIHALPTDHEINLDFWQKLHDRLLRLATLIPIICSVEKNSAEGSYETADRMKALR